MAYERLLAAADFISSRTGRHRHEVGVVLGSGLGGYADELPAAVTVPYGEIPYFPPARVAGHAGKLVSALIDGHPVLVAAGRVHMYEGYTDDEVVFGVRTMALTGCHTVVLTNAAGGISRSFAAGDLVAIRDHINLTGRNPLAGPNDDRLGPRFPDLSDAYSASVRKVIAEAAATVGIGYQEGVYGWMLGPSYETPAEIEMLRRIGADLVGMSTVPEAIALAHMGRRVGAISLVTNLAAGVSATPLSHEEVTEVAAEARIRFTTLLNALLARLAVAPAD